jgi:hypothetical protein
LRTLSGFSFGFGLLLFEGSLFLAWGGGGSRPRLRRSSRPPPCRAASIRDQLVGQNQPCVRDILHHEHHIGILSGGRVIAM